jgi:hypothetical protein
VGEQVVEDGHAHDQAASHLGLDQGRLGVRHPGVDLDPAVHRAGVHHLLARPDAVGRDAPAGGVLAQTGDERGARLHPLALHAEDVHDVRGGDRVDRRRDLATHRLDSPRHERGRPDEGDARAEQRQRLDVRAGNAGVEHVADDRHVQPLDRAELLLEGKEVEQRLRRVLVLAVTGVDHVRVRAGRDQLRRTDLGVSDDDDVRLVRAERDRGVLQRFALIHG